MIDKTNWLAKHNYYKNHRDTFMVTHSENQITVTRTDREKGWGMDLMFTCCPDDGNHLIFYCKYIRKLSKNKYYRSIN